MQSWPTESSQTSSVHESPESTHPNQYGYRGHAAGATGTGLSTEPDLEALDQHPPSTAVFGGGEQPLPEQSGAELSGRLNSETPPKRAGSPVDKIIEHERASPKYAQRKGDGPSFTIVARSKNDTPTGPNLVDFPNEVLTHVFSHLPPASLAAISLVSQRFHELITTPHAWRVAFSRYFPGAESLLEDRRDGGISEEDTIVSEKRYFTRLTALASWRSEYIIRTRLLRSLARGKPAQNLPQAGTGSSRAAAAQTGNAQLTYNSNLFTTVNHLQASFGTTLNRRMPRFIHGADESGAASSSDPSIGRVDNWGLADPVSFLQFAERFPGDAQYGLGPGEVTGMPNSMDVSQPFGMAHADGSPGGLIYYRNTDEHRGRLLAGSLGIGLPEVGIPRVMPANECMTCVWIAKNKTIPDLTNGLIGLIAGASTGIVNAYSIGTNDVSERRFERGEITARWILSPGVPIVAISIDEHFSDRRLQAGRIWVVAINALGEAFYLKDFPHRRSIAPSVKFSKENLDEIAWETGRTAYWTLVEPTRRVATPDPFDRSGVDGSYTPRSSCDSMGLSAQQIAGETREIEAFLGKKPIEFRKSCECWDMQRRLEVDFANDDQNGAGEAIFVIRCGLNEGQTASVDRFTRLLISDTIHHGDDKAFLMSTGSPVPRAATSLFGSVTSPTDLPPTWSLNELDAPDAEANGRHGSGMQVPPETFEVWRTSTLSFGGLKATQITTTAIDESTYATVTADNDPLLSMTSSTTSSPIGSPFGANLKPGSTFEVPGQRSRFLAAGTKIGSIVVWNMRAPVSTTTDLTTTIEPVRIIHTDSPQISCLAMSALYLVHGGNDGLVQAWDPLASTLQPIRTLNSRFSSRARRRLVQAEASPYGVGVNLFAAGALSLDPDPTTLRGMVSLGTHLRYWSYSSNAAEQYKGSKRRLRRSERGSNTTGEKFSHTGRGALKDYIANEKADLERDKANRRKEEERLRGRYGLDLLGSGASDDEVMAYATMLSEEALANDQKRRDSESDLQSIPEGSSAANMAKDADDEAVDPELAEALRRSIEESEAVDSLPSSSYVVGPVEFAVNYKKSKRSPSRSPKVHAAASAGSSRNTDVDDLDFALQLSLAEERSRRELEALEEEDFPTLSNTRSSSSSGSGNGKGKGKGRRRS